MKIFNAIFFCIFNTNISVKNSKNMLLKMLVLKNVSVKK